MEINLENVMITGGFSFEDGETGIKANGSFTVDSVSRKVKQLNGTLMRDDTNIGAIAAHTNNEGRTFTTVSPYDMADAVDAAKVGKGIFTAIEGYDYSGLADNDGQESDEEGAEA